MRDILLLEGSPLVKHDSRWQVNNRRDAWVAYGRRIFDSHLDKFKEIAIAVLSEPDPKFELGLELRFAAALHDKVLAHSTHLRKGIAETLALLGCYPSILLSCSQGKAESIANAVVREVLGNSSWVVWASLDRLLPTIAEASPESFLYSVETGLREKPSPFLAIFDQESGDVTGWNYMSGILWALESLAWSPNHLTRVISLLGDLAEMDPGGRWANRPVNTITEILLPWHPQTCADTTLRASAVKVLLEEHPIIGWKVLITLLPNVHSTTSGTSKPEWRSYLPIDWPTQVTQEEFWKQSNYYSDLAVTVSFLDMAKTQELIGHMSSLGQLSCMKFLSHLHSVEMMSQEESVKFPIWESLVDLVAKHRKYSDALWALPSGMVDKVEEVAAALAPKSQRLVFHRLFSEQDYRLYEDRNFTTEVSGKLVQQRLSAVKEILSTTLLSGVLEFAQEVEFPQKVGEALGGLEDLTENDLLPEYLTTKIAALSQFIQGYVLSRFHKGEWDWIDKTVSTVWTIEQRARFLSFLPFRHETWDRAGALLGEEVSEYWKIAPAYPANSNDLLKASELLMEHKRPRAAVSVLQMVIYEKQIFPAELALRALEESIESLELLNRLDSFAVQDIIKWLQLDENTDVSRLANIEWAYLPLLNRLGGGAPLTLEYVMSEDPNYYCDILGLVYRSDKVAPSDSAPTDAQKIAAQNALRLLINWEIPPGSKRDNSFDGAALHKWIADVKVIAAESGHLRVALNYAGKVLAYAPADPNGLWLHRSVATVLNDRDADELRNSFIGQLYTKRGTFIQTHGEDERILAKDFAAKADALDVQSYHRVATVVRKLAKGYERQAEIDAKQGSDEA